MIASAGLSILLLGLFNSGIGAIQLENFRVVEAGIFVGALFLLRKYKLNAITVILGSGVVGTLIYLPALL